MTKKKNIAKYVKDLQSEGFDPEDFFVLDMSVSEDGEFDIPDLMMPVHSLPPERVRQSIKVASRLWHSIRDVAEGYPLDEQSFLPIERALGEIGQPDPLALFALYLLARDGTHFTDEVKAHPKREKRAKSGGDARAQTFSPARDELLNAWASGVYLNRDVCAEKMAENGLGRFTTLRDWLKGVSNPNPWPARENMKKTKRR